MGEGGTRLSLDYPETSAYPEILGYPVALWLPSVFWNTQLPDTYPEIFLI